jgi:hypothetical protein
MILASYAYGLAVRSSCFGSVRKAFLLSANFPQEGLENRVNLPEDDPEVVSLVLVYLYTGVYCLEAAMPSCFPETVKHKDHDQAATPTIQTKEPELDGALSKSPEEAEVLSTSPSSDCMVHVAVYSCADRLGILSLKALACEKFMTSAKDIDEKSFARLLRAVYENTAAQDSILRAAATLHLASLKSHAQDIPELVEVLHQHEPMVWAIMELFQKELKALKDALQATELSLMERHQEVSSNHTIITRQTETLQKLKAFVEGNKGFCRACGEKLTEVGIIYMGHGKAMMVCRYSPCYHRWNLE